MHIIKPLWLKHGGELDAQFTYDSMPCFGLTLLGEKKDFEVYSCHVSPDGVRLVTAAGGKHSSLQHDLAPISTSDTQQQTATSDSGRLTQ